MIRNFTLFACSWMACCLLLLVPAQAQVILSIDGDDADGTPNPPVAYTFTFDDLGVPGAVTTSGTDLTLDVTDSDAINGVFGGLGFGIGPALEFDSATHRIAIDLTVFADNVGDEIAIILQDQDGIDLSTFLPKVEQHQYFFGTLSTVTPGVPFTLTQDIVPPDFTFQPSAAAGGFDPGVSPGDGIVNFDAVGALDQLQIQAPFGSVGDLHITIHDLRIEVIPVPEPATLGLIACSTVGLLMTRRRNRLC